MVRRDVRQRRLHPEHGLDDLALAPGQLADERGPVVEVDDVGDHVLADRLGRVAHEPDRLVGEPAPVPGAGEPARDPADLGTADRQAVVVELLPEPERVGVETRAFLQTAARDEFIQTLERIVQRKVYSFHSTCDPSTGMVIEIAVFEPRESGGDSGGSLSA